MVEIAPPPAPFSVCSDAMEVREVVEMYDISFSLAILSASLKEHKHIEPSIINVLKAWA